MQEHSTLGTAQHSIPQHRLPPASCRGGHHWQCSTGWKRAQHTLHSHTCWMPWTCTPVPACMVGWLLLTANCVCDTPPGGASQQHPTSCPTPIVTCVDMLTDLTLGTRCVMWLQGNSLGAHACSSMHPANASEGCWYCLARVGPQLCCAITVCMLSVIEAMLHAMQCWSG
jgi:hypothetical protein